MSSEKSDSGEAPTASYGWSNPEAKCSVNYCLPGILLALEKHKSKTVADVGCGNGAMTSELAARGYAVSGFEPDAEGVAIARQAHPAIEFAQASVYDEYPSGQSLDAVVSSEVIEHLFDPAALLSFSRRLLKPDGILILTTPYHGYWKNLALSLMNKWDNHFKSLRVGGHIKFWSVHTLSELLTNEGFRVVDFGGAGRPWPFWASMIVVAQPTSAVGTQVQ